MRSIAGPASTGGSSRAEGVPPQSGLGFTRGRARFSKSAGEAAAGVRAALEAVAGQPVGAAPHWSYREFGEPAGCRVVSVGTFVQSLGLPLGGRSAPAGE